MPSTPRHLAALVLCLAAATSAGAAGNRFCGGPANPGDPADLANVVGDQTLEYMVSQPASVLTCSKGYMLEKCGDHESAHLIFDKCIAAGYAGAMIWKALLLDDGTGVPQDSAKAAELLHRAAVSGDPAYGPVAKLHYATMLDLGRGVPRDERAARAWFEAAAAEGNPEAKEFLKTGYHTGYRDKTGLGAGTPTAAALAGPPAGDNASLSPPPGSTALPAAARKLVARTAPPAPPPAPATPEAAPVIADVTGPRLERRDPAPLSAPLPAAPVWLGLVLATAFAAGLLAQKRRRDYSFPLP